MKMFCVANKGYRCAAPTKVTGALHLAIMYGICCVTKITGATHLQRLSVLRTYKGYRCYAPSADVWALLCYQCYRCSAPSADVWVLFCYQGYRCYAPKTPNLKPLYAYHRNIDWCMVYQILARFSFGINLLSSSDISKCS
jgi:hypothetical protein